MILGVGTPPGRGRGVTPGGFRDGTPADCGGIPVAQMTRADSIPHGRTGASHTCNFVKVVPGAPENQQMCFYVHLRPRLRGESKKVRFADFVLELLGIVLIGHDVTVVAVRHLASSRSGRTCSDSALRIWKVLCCQFAEDQSKGINAKKPRKLKLPAYEVQL